MSFDFRGQTLLNKLSKVIIVDDKSEESDFRHKERVTLLSNAVKLSGLLMIIEVKEKNLEPKEVFNNFEAFLPKRKLWSGNYYNFKHLANSQKHEILRFFMKKYF